MKRRHFLIAFDRSLRWVRLPTGRLPKRTADGGETAMEEFETRPNCTSDMMFGLA